MNSSGTRGTKIIASLSFSFIFATMVSSAFAQVPGVTLVIGKPNPVVKGQSVTFTAGVNWTASEVPSGTITLTDTATCSGAITKVVMGTIMLGSSTSATPGAASLTFSSFPCTGSNSIVASYSGDSNYSAAQSQPLVETVAAQFTPTVTTLTSSFLSATAGQSITLTAKLGFTLADNTNATGTINFTDMKTGKVVGTASVQTSGSRTQTITGASIVTSSLAAGSYSIQAVYSGDNIYAPSSSQPLAITIVNGAVVPTISRLVTSEGNEASQNVIIAQNTWIEIHGSNLAQTTEDWGSQDFSNGLPTSLGGVTATINTKPAAIGYISPTQINILTPLDDSTGTIPIALSTPNGSATPVTQTMAQVSPSFLVLDGARHVAARHVDFSLAGPATLSAPGYPFTPVKPGEIVLLYAVGFGQTSPPITDQLHGSGLLPTLPAVTIGGIPASVQGAGISGPGLYQLNVVVPLNSPDGDLPVSAVYEGSSTQSAVVLTVQH
jgi:uncharacterized protein (TIGR03437 family)